jgi:hypothetical protein
MLADNSDELIAEVEKSLNDAVKKASKGLATAVRRGFFHGLSSISVSQLLDANECWPFSSLKEGEDDCARLRRELNVAAYKFGHAYAVAQTVRTKNEEITNGEH